MENPDQLKNEIKNLITSTPTKRTLQLLTNRQLSNLDKEVIMLNNKYSEIQSNKGLGIISDEDEDKGTEMTKLNVRILDLLDRIGSGSIDKLEYAYLLIFISMRMNELYYRLSIISIISVK